MSYKTIAVHLESEFQADHLLKAAVSLGNQYESHLIGSCVLQPLGPYVARAAGTSVSAELAHALQKTEFERADRLKTLFQAATNNQNLVPEWRLNENLLSTVSSGVLEQARSSDLLMMGVKPKDTSDGFESHLMATVITNSSRPTVLVPESYEDKSLGKYVFIAWDGSRESSRAVFDALPMLKRAENVWLHRVKESNEDKQHGEDATKNLAAALARHEVNIELSESASSTRKVGQEILTHAQHRGADCIVMGAYGHNRLHGLLLGDTTRYLLDHSKVPLLMSH